MHYNDLNDARRQLTGAGGEFEIVEQEILGSQIKTYKNAPNDLREVWTSSERYGDRNYLVYGNERISYAQAHKVTTSISGWLYDQGLRPGDRIAIAMRNYPEWMLIYWACSILGITVVGLNAWWSSSELAYGINDAAPKIIFADEERLQKICDNFEIQTKPKVVGVRSPSRLFDAIDWEQVVSFGERCPIVQIDPDSDACIFYTSGTTGFPKGAQLTHRSCIANLINLQFAARCASLAIELATGNREPQRTDPFVGLITTPLFHVSANNCGAFQMTAVGGTIVLMHHWDAAEALKIIEREKVTHLRGAPVMGRELVNHVNFARTDTSSLLSVSGGGAPVPPDQVQEIEDKLASARPATGYGMTETSGIITFVSGDFYVDKPDCVGPAMPNFDIKIIDENGDEVPPGELGELIVRGSSVVKGYLNRQEATRSAIVDGWLHTGDIARIDADNFIYIVDRKKDMLIRGGENVFCAEVEAGIYRHQAVAECCVFGVPDDRLGEEVAATVVLKPNFVLREEELRSHCVETLSNFKIPRYIWFHDEPLPRNANGKVLKRKVRDQYMKLISNSQ